MCGLVSLNVSVHVRVCVCVSMCFSVFSGKPQCTVQTCAPNLMLRNSIQGVLKLC